MKNREFFIRKNDLIPCNVTVTSKLCCVSVESAGPGPEKNETSDFLVKNSMRQRVSEKISPIQKKNEKVL